jgi:hypothetical protein
LLTKAICRRSFTPAQPDCPAASVRDFLSGAYTRRYAPGPQISQIAQAIIAELSHVGGTKVTLKLDIDAEAPADFPSDVVDVVNANAKTLKFEQSGFS